MGRKRRQRRQSHGSAWHWKQTDIWYYTPPGTKRRVALRDDRGRLFHRFRDGELAVEAQAADYAHEHDAVAADVTQAAFLPDGATEAAEAAQHVAQATGKAAEHVAEIGRVAHRTKE